MQRRGFQRIESQKPIVLKFLRSKYHPRSVLIDDNLNLYPFGCLKRGGYVV